MKIVVLDSKTLNPGDLSWEPLAPLGELTVYDRTDSEEETVRRIGDAEIVVTNKTPIPASVLAACPSIRFIAVTATGFNVIDCEAAADRHIPVANVPAYGTAIVAQFTFALLLELCHHVGLHDESTHRGDWTRSPEFCYWLTPQTELAGKTLGIIGFGRIGQAVGKIAAALGMEVIFHNRSPRTCDYARQADLDTLLRTSDVITLHCPLFPETEGIINRDAIAKMKDGVRILNTSRGPLIREQDLADALRSGKVAGAAVDVISSEPMEPDNPLLTAPNCIITPHIAWAARESRARILDTTRENIASFLAGTPQNIVNA